MKKTEARQRKTRVVTTTTTTRVTTRRSRGAEINSNSKPDLDSVTSGVSVTHLAVGIILMLILGFQYSSLMETVHENNLWFSNIKEVEREISFRTESGLYYSYYKTFVEAPSIAQGFRELMYDNGTEHGRTINILERFNIYQEVLLGIVYKFLPFNAQPVYLYIRSVFFLHGLLLCCLYALTWCMTGSWLAGAFTALLYIFNRADTTRAAMAIPLRESFSVPFLWGQILCIHVYMNNKVKDNRLNKLLVAGIALCSINFTLTWQFAQFVLLLQAAALYVVWVLDYIPTHKIRNIYLCQLAAIFVCYALQFGNKMVLGSLVLGVIPAVLLAMLIKKKSDHGSGVFLGLLKAAFYSIFVAVITLVINKLIKVGINLEADEHIFKFVMNKFGFGNPRDFDTLLYMCNGAFEFLDKAFINRTTIGVVLPLYLLVHIGLIVMFVVATFQNWGKVKAKKNDTKNNNNEGDDMHSVEVEESQALSLFQSVFKRRPALAYHTVQTVFFCIMGIMVMRMKFLWSPYMCVLAPMLVADEELWTYINYTKYISTRKNKKSGSYIRHVLTTIAITILLVIKVPGLLKELDDLREFYDPDTVELMEWINNNTLPHEAFTGSMQLLAGVKLSTKRPLLNHPHYEDKVLRQRTKELYCMYGKHTPEEVYDVMKSYDVTYMILEDSICLTFRKTDGCGLPVIMDLDSGVLPSGYEPTPGLTPSDKPQFCDMIRHGRREYTKYFKTVFTNKTFRIYKVL